MSLIPLSYTFMTILFALGQPWLTSWGLSKPGPFQECRSLSYFLLSFFIKVSSLFTLEGIEGNVQAAFYPDAQQIWYCCCCFLKSSASEGKGTGMINRPLGIWCLGWLYLAFLLHYAKGGLRLTSVSHDLSPTPKLPSPTGVFYTYKGDHILRVI